MYLTPHPQFGFAMRASGAADGMRWARKLKEPKPLTQEGINKLIVRRPGGQSVTRLKGGDPVLFGRGTKKRRSWQRCGHRFEIVPGITSGDRGTGVAASQ